MNLRAPVKGWQRFEPAAQWLLASARPAAESVPEQPAGLTKAMLLKFVESEKGGSSDQEELFNRFVLWYRENGAQAPQQR